MTNQPSHMAASQMINTIEKINHDIASAIKITDFKTALELDQTRQMHLSALKDYEGPLSAAQFDQLQSILNSVKSEVISIETAIYDLNENTGKHIRRLNGYR